MDREQTRSDRTSQAVGIRFAVVAGLLLAMGCDSSNPTDPGMPDVVSTDADDMIFLSPSPLSVGIGGSAEISIRVQPPPGVDAGISTDLGDFGTDGSGQPIVVTTVPLDDAGSGRITWNAGDAPGTANIVASSGATLSTLRATVNPATALFVTSINPKIGDPGGGETVTISGQGFLSEPMRPIRVTFGDASADVGAVTASSIEATTPPSTAPVEAGASLTVDVVVTLAGDSSTPAMADTLSGAFTYNGGMPPPGGPMVFAIVPSSGTNVGGDQVTIIGQGFETPLQVAFGRGTSPDDFNGSDAIIQSASSTQIVVTTPMAPSTLTDMTADVLVRNQGTGAAALGRALFTYQGDLLVSNIVPQENSYTGDLMGGALTLFGRGFTIPSRLSVEIGGTMQSGGMSNADGTQLVFDRMAEATVIDCMPPSGPAIVTNLDTGSTAQSMASFTYTAESPQVLGADPAFGRAEGGDPLRLSGTFSTEELLDARITVDGVLASIDGTTARDELRVITPAFTGMFDTESCMDGAGTIPVAKAVDITVRYLNTGCSSTLAGSFRYEPTNPVCDVPDEIPEPSFIFGPDPRGDLLTVAFTNTTSNTEDVTWMWFFGDGSSSREEQPAPHAYPSEGLFTVVLRATNSAGTGSFSQAVSVPLPGTLPDPPTASFTVNVIDQTAFFTNTTSPLSGVTWQWLFGDGVSSRAQDPSHTYSQPGSFTVTLRATNAGGTDTFQQQVTIDGPRP